MEKRTLIYENNILKHILIFELNKKKLLHKISFKNVSNNASF